MKLDHFYHLEYSVYCLHCYLHNVSGDAPFSRCFKSNSGAHTEHRTEQIILPTWVDCNMLTMNGYEGKVRVSYCHVSTAGIEPATCRWFHKEVPFNRTPLLNRSINIIMNRCFDKTRRVHGTANLITITIVISFLSSCFLSSFFLLEGGVLFVFVLSLFFLVSFFFFFAFILSISKFRSFVWFLFTWFSLFFFVLFFCLFCFCLFISELYQIWQTCVFTACFVWYHLCTRHYILIDRFVLRNQAWLFNHNNFWVSTCFLENKIEKGTKKVIH